MMNRPQTLETSETSRTLKTLNFGDLQVFQVLQILQVFLHACKLLHFHTFTLLRYVDKNRRL
jgi:hypothetical protein